MVSTRRNKTFLNISLPVIAIMASKNMNEEISFPGNRKSVHWPK